MRVIGVVAVVVAFAGSAIAQPAGSKDMPPPVDPVPARPPAEPRLPPSAAEQAFLEGRALMDEGKHAEACAKFEASIKLDPEAAGTLLNLGLCNERLGRVATALAWFRKAQFRAAETSMTDYEDVAKNSTFMLAVRVPTLRISVTNAPPGSTVHVDDKQISEIELAKVEVDPGAHVVELRIQGKQPVRAEVTVKDGDHRDVALTFVPEAPPPPVKIFVEIDRGEKRRLLAYLVGGAGVAMWGGSLAVSLVARSDYNASEHPQTRADATNLARLGGTGLFIAGTAAVAGAVLLYVYAPGVERVERTALTPVVGSDQLGLVVHGAF